MVTDQKNRQEDVPTLGLRGALKRWWFLVVIVTVVATVSAGVATTVISKPTYTVTHRLLVSNSQNASTTESVQNELPLIPTIMAFYQDPEIMNRVKHQQNLSYESSELPNAVSISHGDSSLFINVSVSLNSEDDARRFASELIKQANRQIMRQYPSIRMVDVTGATVSVSSPSITRNCVAAFGASLILMLLIICILPQKRRSSPKHVSTSEGK